MASILLETCGSEKKLRPSLKDVEGMCKKRTRKTTACWMHTPHGQTCLEVHSIGRNCCHPLVKKQSF